MYNVSGLVLAEKPYSGIVTPTRLYDASRFKNHGVYTDITDLQLPSGLWVRGPYNGSSSLVTVMLTDSLKPGLGGFSVLQWFKQPATAATRQIMSCGGSGSPGYTSWVSNAGTLFAEYEDAGIRAQASSVAPVYEDDAWHFVVFTKRVSDGKTYLYIDGEYDNVSANALTATVLPTHNLFTGVNFAGGSDFTGTEGLLKLVRRELSPGQIKNIYEKQLRDWFI